jgi:CDP-6-deoxy-D-xylo-4-hexulose-3-dehydrase
MNAPEERKQILEAVSAFHGTEFADRPFQPGRTPVPVSGRVFDADDLVHLVDSALDFWLTSGRFAARFERDFARYLGVRHAVLCNSGSSANLLALSALTSPKLGDRRLVPGDEVITVAAGFPTTVNPIVQNRLVPVFCDIDLATYNIDSSQLDSAIGPRTRAIMVAHTMGHPWDVQEVTDLAQRHGLWIVEDNCDALGSRYDGRLTGTFGDLATASFYPAHHITMGEGGAVVTNRPHLKVLVESFRDWGRDCWCAPGEENTCEKRFDWQLGCLPQGYDHKYIFSHVGYNMKVTDMQAAVGVAQLAKLPSFIETRKRNWRLLREGLAEFDDLLMLPSAAPRTDPSWFGFLITVRPNAPFDRDELVRFLDKKRIATRLLFGGDITQQPAYENVEHRVVGRLDSTRVVMERTFWIGVYPGVTEEMVSYVIESFREFVHGRNGHRATSSPPARRVVG